MARSSKLKFGTQLVKKGLSLPLSLSLSLKDLNAGRQVHGYVVKSGFEFNLVVGSSLAHMYIKSGSLGGGERVIKAMPIRNVVSCITLIAGIAQNGFSEGALDQYNMMKMVGFRPDKITFVSVISSCSELATLGQGQQIHAEDAIIWKTLLSACKIHENADISKRIAEEVLRLDPQDSAPYVLLLNVQASAKRWQDVSEVRKVMRDRRVKKEPGISWFEVKNQVHQFCVGDKFHPQSMQIDMYLKELTWEMKLTGYVPDTGSVLHDMDAEEKEYNLAHHSEKLAIAFALMNTPDGVPIRVMKNLRVCCDCHVAIKYISEIKKNIIK
ncbi:pentatricopeptide repeat-containing protein At2g41080-like [Camellia sinensis]|uniref:pentatricopeptide repeat-containing protein At2g41080-like n=1 Tax=Camellia sinensis TaxID=4442 RepID=UPI0010362A5B|nr:pentatricopeptide repeat-containing protein At2g41080-like [Camellia sinensis]